MPSGLRLACVVLAGKDGGEPWVTPARATRERDGRTSYEDVVTWCSPERRKAWTEMALAAVRPHLQAPPAREEAQDGYCPF